MESEEDARRYDSNRSLVFKLLGDAGLLPLGRENDSSLNFVKDIGIDSLAARDFLIKIACETDVDLVPYIDKLSTVKDVVNALYERRTDYSKVAAPS